MEIVAPAGSIDSLRAAVCAGADAVYLGLGSFSARAKATDFDLDNLQEWVRYCHIFGVKVFVAVNILVLDSEVEQTLCQIKQAWSMGVDAVIVQDLGLAQLIHSTMPDIVLHASTQMGIHNVYGALFAGKMGISRVILSRETTLEDIRAIRAQTDIQLEYFAHGALCVSFSGNCYFSSVVSGQSGNRGRCLQLCRKKYQLVDGERVSDGYYLSARDLCLAEHLMQLRDAGIDSIKIEGRMRRPEYVGEAVHCYRQALESRQMDISRLQTLFNRGDYTTGYLHQSTIDPIYPLAQAHIGLRIGAVNRVHNGVAQLHTNRSLCAGDGLKFLRQGQEVGHGEFSATTSDSTTFVGDVRPGDAVHLTTSTTQLAQIAARTRLIDVDVQFVTRGDVAQLTVSTDTASATVWADIVQPSRGPGWSLQEIKQALSKMGGTHFRPRAITASLECEQIFIVRSALNQLRRQALESLCDVLCEQMVSRRKSVARASDWTPVVMPKEDFGTIIQISDIEQIPLVEPLADAVSYAPTDYNLTDIERFVSKVKKPVWLNLPPIARASDLEVLSKIAKSRVLYGVIAQNVYAFELFCDHRILAGQQLNVINSHSNIQAIRGWDASDSSDSDYLCVYGHIPLMTLCHCPRSMRCGSCDPDSPLFLIDQKGYRLRLQRIRVGNCYHLLLNPVPYCIIDQVSESRRIFIDLAYCDHQEVEDIVNGRLPTVRTSANYHRKIS